MGLLKTKDAKQHVREEAMVDELFRRTAKLEDIVHIQAAWIDALLPESFDRRGIHNGSPKRLCAERGCGACRGATGIGPPPTSPLVPPKPFSLAEPPFQICCGRNPTLHACLKNKCAKALNTDDARDYESWQKRYIGVNRQVLRDHPEARAMIERRIKELQKAGWIA